MRTTTQVVVVALTSVLVLSSPVASAQTGALVGNPSVLPTSVSLPTHTARAFRFTATASGSSTQADVYIDSYQNRASTLYVAVYSDNNGIVGGLLASGSTTSIIPGAWNSVTMPTVQITHGQMYWLAIFGSGGQLGYRDSYGGCNTSKQSGLSSPPTTWGGRSSGNACASAYLGGTAGPPPPPPPPPNPVPPSNTSLPTINGTPQQGDTLTAIPGGWNGDTPMTFTYTWSDGTTGPTDTLSSADVGKTVTVTVTASNDANTPVSATSQPVGPVQAASSPPPPPPPPSGFQSVLFWLGWDGGDYTAIPWNSVTQVDMFSLASCVSAGSPAADCTGPAGISSQFNGVNNPTTFTSTVHQHGRLAIITIGGSTNPDWYYACQPADVAQFAQNLVSYMQSNGFDGIDLDIEQDPGSTFTAADLQACVQDVYNDAKAVKTAAGNTPIVTSDVDPTTNFDIGKIEGPYVDQFNAMSYGATGSQLSTWITNLHNNSNIPYSKITAGIDVTGTHDCPSTASYAVNSGLAGTMVWFGQADAGNSYACLNAIAPHVG